MSREPSRDIEHLAAALGHDLRGQLNALNLFAELITRGVQPQEAAASIKKVVGQLDRTFTRLQAYLRRVPQSPSDTSIEALWSALSGRWPSIGFTREIDTVPVCATDMERVIVELVDNARAHGAEPIEVRLGESDRGVVLVVRDSGLGFTDPVRAMRLLGTGRPDDHAGTGLNEVRLVVDHHGGQLLIQRGRPEVRVEIPYPSVTPPDL